MNDSFMTYNFKFNSIGMQRIIAISFSVVKRPLDGRLSPEAQCNTTGHFVSPMWCFGASTKSLRCVP